MARVTPRKVEEKIATITAAWQELAGGKSFGGMTLPQFQAAVQPSLGSRTQIAQLEQQLTLAMNERDNADKVTLEKIQLVVNGVIGDPTEGPDSSLYEGMGYTRKSERQSGLTRTKKTIPTP